MSSAETTMLVEHLLARAPAFEPRDIAIGTHDFTSQPWLEIGRLDGIPYGWLAGTEPGAKHFWRTPEVMAAGENAEPPSEVAARIGAVRRLGSGTRSLVVRGGAGIELDLLYDSDFVNLVSCHERVAGFAPDDALMHELLAELARAGWRLPARR